MSGTGERVAGRCPFDDYDISHVCLGSVQERDGRAWWDHSPDARSDRARRVEKAAERGVELCLASLFLKRAEAEREGSEETDDDAEREDARESDESDPVDLRRGLD